MKLRIAFIFLLLAAPLLPQTTQDDYNRWKTLPPANMTPFGPGEVTRQSKLPQIAGCNCSSDDKIEVSPDPVVAIVNQPVRIRFDATPICNGQGFRDLGGNDISTKRAVLGSVKWESLSEEGLYNFYGYLTSPPYQQAGKYTITIDLSLQCYDTGAKCKSDGHYKICPLKQARIGLTVLTADEAKKKGISPNDPNKK